MREERHRRLEELFAVARERPETERRAFLDEVCGDDRGLCREVLSLLAYDFTRTEDADASILDFPESRGFVSGGLAPGTLLAERYRIAEVLGRGAMGEVYRAEDLKLGQTVALKLLPEAARDDPGRLGLLLDEVRIARAIGHPNVCRVYDVGEADGAHFLSMEYIDGEDLAALLRRVGRLPQDRARAIGRELCEGLAAVHDQGILHRDLKPANVLTDGEGRVRLADFGMAAVAGAEARGGTPAYMAPELCAGELSVKSDLYALGLVLYELFCGQPAFEAGSMRELERLHREVEPRPPGALAEDLAAATERVILQCLEKDPRDRPASARAVAVALAGRESDAAVPAAAGSGRPPRPEPESGAGKARLRHWPAPELPERPYPVLLPYTHPALFAGRGRELRELSRRLRLPVPILGLYAASGAGKSSLLAAGLVPGLRDAGVPVALVRHPQEPALARRLLADLLQMEELVGDAVEVPPRSPRGDAEAFVDHLHRVARLAGEAPVLVVDQLEDVLRAAEARPRALLGILLAATAERRPGDPGPLCRWVLAYRQEHHGEVVSWLGDVLAEARAAELSVAAEWPHDLAAADRFDAVKLSPLGAPPPRSGLAASASAALDEVTGVFRAVLEKPLALTDDDGAPRYAWRFAGAGAERLARAFAEVRLARPDAPLTPELQVVLAHLLAQAGPDSLVEVPEDPGPLIAEALEDHLERALESAFPAAAGGATPRRGGTRALLALRELATSTGRREEGLAPEELARAIGDGGEEVLEKLATPTTRLVVLQARPDGSLRYVLSHDRLAEVVVRLVEKEGRHGKLTVDRELLALRRFVALESALYRSQEEVATRLDRRHTRRIARNAEALLWDEERRAWWTACRRRRRADLLRATTWTAAALVFLGLLTWGIRSWVGERQQHQALLDQVVQGEPGVALQALDRLMDDPETSSDGLLTLLRRREVPMDVLERGLDGIPGKDLSSVVLRTVEIALPWVAENPGDPVLLANLVWALDYGPGRDPTAAARARALRDQVLEPLRRLRPPPSISPQDPDWVEIPAGTFQMGSPEGEGYDEERPRHEVTVSVFRILRHEVTNADYRLLVPDHPGEGDLPAALMSWYESYTYAAWLGGRLPTEAEWEYAARADCPYAYCAQDGQEATVDDVAWTRHNSRDPETGERAASAGMRLAPNPWGLYDMLGNLWEWTTDEYAPYPPGPQADPWVSAAASGGERVTRGGSFWNGAGVARVANRFRDTPGNVGVDLGCRVVLPRRPEP